ncbi:YigZ family protein [Tepidibacillus fermentans]|uniref:Putative YigZ family protein n=1 Tax=Tepidibacillus fermentans TaxID=1281767 RepID=A0A4R3KJK5_9BACI|nr:YigZ family protein [Tepidibacillus fermentans]TCS83351.1 putative YigZ family protein [Tepidibacillus fermentans]
MLKRYLTTRDYGETSIIIRKSEFIGYVKHVETEEEAIAFIDSIKKKHWDATHNCSAYVIGEHDQIQKANDDGEPSGTAGKPILEVIKKQQLKDTCIVVTRYFGGILLGAGGLIRAYGQTASEAIKAAGVIERVLHTVIDINIDYTWLGKIENELNNRAYRIKDIEYLDRVTIHVLVEEGNEENFINWIIDLTNGQAKVTRKDQIYVDIPYEQKDA